MTEVPAGAVRVDRVDDGSVAVFHVAGEVDALTAPELDKALSSFYGSRDNVSHVVLDLSGVSFLSSAGLTVLAGHHARCAQEGVDLCAVAVRRSPRRVLEITELDRVIPLYDTVADARTAIADGAWSVDRSRG
jgi:anti-sigma B factor antagonist